eukprot:COSAG01_NODE_75942_length_191_cov_72.793478_1_plen_36_part_01
MQLIRRARTGTQPLGMILTSVVCFLRSMELTVCCII